MELHALDPVHAVPDAHHLAVLGPRRDDELGGDVERRERVVATRLDLLRQARVHALAVVTDDARLAVQERLRAPDLPAERLDDRLVAEADAERRDARAERADEVDGDAGVLGPARAPVR